MKKRIKATVNLPYEKRKALEKKYNKIIKKMAKAKKSPPSKEPQESTDGSKNSFFKYAYRFYYLLDVPPSQAYSTFCECMRTSDEGKAVAYLYDFGLRNRDEILEVAKNSTIAMSEDIENKFEYIKDKIKCICFDRLSK